MEGPPKKTVAQVDGVEAHQVAPGLTVLMGSAHDRLRTNIEYALNAGSTDNTYVVAGKDGTNVIIDVPTEPFLEAWLKEIEKVLASRGGAGGVTDLVITHMTPQRIPSLRAFLSLRAADPDVAKLRVHLSNPGSRVLEAGVGCDEEGRAILKYGLAVNVVKAGSAPLSIGSKGSEVLELVLVPSPRWPDLLAVYSPVHRTLFSSKLFSAHVAMEDHEWSDAVGGHDAYTPHWRHFFETTLAPIARQASDAVGKLGIEPAGAPKGVWGGLQVWMGITPSVPDLRPCAVIAPIHGPVIKSGVADILAQYDQWFAQQLRALDTCQVSVFYASAYGNTLAIAQAITHGLTRAGLGVRSVNLEFATPDEIADAVQSSQGFAIGSPTLQGHMPTQVQGALGTLLQQPSAGLVPCGVFGSFGWSGEAVDEIAGKLRDGGYNFAFEPIRIKFTPTREALLACEDAGVKLATEVKKVQRRRETSVVSDQSAASTASGAQLAMGRVVGPLCVVTAKDEDATGAMLASWVSQAGFNPPSLTIAVKKDRALEPLLVPGNALSVSVLAEGDNTKKTMRVLTKPFAPGADRLADLETEPAPNNGCPVVKGAASFLECSVTNRMDAGDHYLVLAEVKSGDVTSAVPSSVHHRKVGNHY